MGTSTRDTHDTYAWHTYHATRDTWLHVYLVAELVISVIVVGPEQVIVLRPQPPHGVTRPRPSAVKGVAGAGGSQALSHLGNIIMTTITWWRSLVTNLCYQIVTHSPGGTGRLLRLETVRSLGSSHRRCSQSLQSIQLKIQKVNFIVMMSLKHTRGINESELFVLLRFRRESLNVSPV